MQKLFFCCVMGMLSVGAWAQDYSIQAQNWIGCKSRETFGELSNYLADGDQEAWKKAATDYVLAGQCTLFTKGEPIFVEELAMFRGLARLRRKGETVSYWTNIEATLTPKP